MKTRILVTAVLAALMGVSAQAQSNAIPGTGATAQVNDLSSVAITGAGAITVTPRIGPHALPANNVPVDNSPAGLAYVVGNLLLSGTEISPTDSIPSPGQTTTGPTSKGLYTLTKTAALVPGGGASDAFVGYGTITNTPTPYWTYPGATAALTPGSYAGLTYASDNLSVGSNLPLCFYTIHHSTSSVATGSVPTDYFAQLSSPAQGFVDVKTMSGGTVPATPGLTGYISLAYATSVPTVAGNNMWYLRTAGAGDHLLVNGVASGAATTAGDILVGWMAPAVSSGSNDVLNLNAASTKGSFAGTPAAIGGYTAFAFLNATPSVGNYTANVFYYLRQDVSVGAGGTGNTILGKLDPSTVVGTRTLSDIANLGAVYTALTFVPTDQLGSATGGGAVWGIDQFYVTGSTPTTAQSVSFPALADRLISAGAFTVNPTASSGLPVTLSVVAGSTGSATISAPVSGVFTITPTQPGIITLQATQVGAVSPVPYSSNMLRQSFTVTGLGVPVITNSPLTAAGSVNAAFNFAVTASNSPTTYTASPLPTGVTIAAATGVISGTPSVIGTTITTLTATNAAGTGSATLTITIAAAGAAPIITNSPLTPGATVGTAFTFTITASGSPTSYSAAPLPAGLSIVAATGVITGTPTAAGTTAVLLGATNGSGTGNATLTITVGAAGVAPVITNSPLTAAGTINTPFSFTITASGSPTSYSAAPLPAGLSIVAATGIITGTPTTVGTTAVLLGATNATGTGNATLNITVAAAGVAPIITNNPLTAAGTTGTPFSFAITASGSPLSYSAAPLPAGLSIVAATGVITGTPSSSGTSIVALNATNVFGSGGATLTITIGSPGSPPSITNNPLTAAGTVGVPFGFTITASGGVSGYGATSLPPGLSLNSSTGVITGTPTTVGVSAVSLSVTNGNGTSFSTLTITVAPATVAPIITSPTTAPATAGTPFPTYVIVATGLPTSYTATGLPPGLSLNALTGAISGTPTTPGTYLVTITATNSAGTSTSTLTITVAPAAVAPIITSPTIATGTLGTPFVTYLIAATGLPTSYTAFNLPPGLSLNALTGAINGTPTASGTTFVTLNATNSTGTSTATLMIVIAPAATAPIITSPAATTGAVGTPFTTFLIAATGLPTSYTATGLPPGLTLNALTGAINGTPTVAGNYVVTLTATNSLGTSTATLLITVGPNLSSRITNFSARAISGPGDQTLIMGFVVAGNGKNLLVRGVGPTLAAFGLTNVLADPLLTLFNGSGAIASNDDWSIDSTGVNQSATIAATALRVGAFALPAGSKDSALLITLNNGAHTSGLLRPNSTTGVALTEIYDTDATVGARLINVSARMNVSGGDGTLIAGFVIGGTVPKTLLIRGVGPTLSVFGVGGVLADPQIAVYSGSTLVGSNDNWEASTRTAVEIISASAQVGAFSLPAGSKDAVLLITLQPGAYTVLVTGVANTSGVALIEIYDTQ